MRTPSLVSLVLAGAIAGTALLSGPANSEESPALERVKIFISKVVDEAVGELFPPGADEMFELIENAPEIIKGGLIVWLNKKMAETVGAALDAEQRGNITEAKMLWDKNDRYQTFYTCVHSGDCGKLNNLQAAGAWAEGTATAATFNNPRTAKGNFVDRCYAFASGCDDNDNPDPAAKPAASEFCKRQGFKSVAPGGSHWSYKAPTEILSSGETCTDPKQCGGLDIVSCQ